MRQLDHPNIVKLIDFAESRQYYYIVLELAPGGELFHQIVRLTYFSEDLSRHVILQVAKALLYLHEETGVVHRYVSISTDHAPFTDLVVTSNPKTCCSIRFPLFQARTQSLELPKTKTRPTRVSSYPESALVELVRSRLPILVCRKLYGIPRL